ncbi:hypothetical protein [Acidiphilium sp.]|uniref:hypothetical protein n=1 Tax=Acidiphilium sp. TaxID=527 RepID=UPI003D02153B
MTADLDVARLRRALLNFWSCFPRFVEMPSVGSGWKAGELGRGHPGHRLHGTPREVFYPVGRYWTCPLGWKRGSVLGNLVTRRSMSVDVRRGRIVSGWPWQHSVTRAPGSPEERARGGHDATMINSGQFSDKARYFCDEYDMKKVGLMTVARHNILLFKVELW